MGHFEHRIKGCQNDPSMPVLLFSLVSLHRWLQLIRTMRLTRTRFPRRHRNIQETRWKFIKLLNVVLLVHLSQHHLHQRPALTRGRLDVESPPACRVIIYATADTTMQFRIFGYQTGGYTAHPYTIAHGPAVETSPAYDLTCKINMLPKYKVIVFRQQLEIIIAHSKKRKTLARNTTTGCIPYRCLRAGAV